LVVLSSEPKLVVGSPVSDIASLCDSVDGVEVSCDSDGADVTLEI
jgi:hypothetical protein